MTPEELGEKVTEAIHRARFLRVRREPESMDQRDREYCEYLAAAAISVVREAMREPSREMWTEINAADDKAYAGGSQHGAGFEMLWAVAMAVSPLAARKQEATRDAG